MLDALRKFMASLTRGADREFDDGDHRLAAAALMVHVAAADGVTTDSERQRLLSVVASGFDLDPDQAERLIEEARQLDLEASDFTGFVDVLRRALDAGGRLRVLEMILEIAWADGIMHEFESDMVDRVGELLEIDAGSMTTLRLAAEAGKNR